MLFISGPAATDALTGVNKYTFRSGRQSYQDVLTAESFLGDPKGKKVTVFAQDSAFGQANVAAVKAVIGGAGRDGDACSCPASATDLTPFASAGQGRQGRTCSSWPGPAPPPRRCGRRWTSRACSTSTTVVTGLRHRRLVADLRRRPATRSRFLAHYFDGAADNEAEQGADARRAKAAARSTCSTRTASPPRR